MVAIVKGVIMIESEETQRDPTIDEICKVFDNIEVDVIGGLFIIKNKDKSPSI